MASRDATPAAEGATPGAPRAGEAEPPAGGGALPAAPDSAAAAGPGVARSTAGQADAPADGAASAPPETVPDEPNDTKFSFREEAGFVPITVRYANVQSWVQRAVWVAPGCNSDHLKWGLRHQLGGSVSTWRVHEGFRGHSYDRYRPILQGALQGPIVIAGAPAAVAAEALQGPIVIAQSFGP